MFRDDHDSQAPARQQSDVGHQPVLLDAVLDLLRPRPGMVYLDCTVGRAGHAAAVAERIGPGGRIIGLDRDAQNVAFAGQRLTAAQGQGTAVDLVHANFATARQILAERGIDGVDLLLADLGFASTQMDDPTRGFSFSADGPLDMRMDRSESITAAELINELSQDTLADLIYQYGEERLSRRIARKIIEQRHQAPMTSTGQLAQIVCQVYGPRGRRYRIHPATRTFMALRIAVNHELESLERLLEDLPDLLQPGGVAAVISFHSLEDRLVKRAFAELRRSGRAELLTRRPVTADDEQCRANPRSRSAKLRAIRLAATTGD